MRYMQQTNDWKVPVRLAFLILILTLSGAAMAQEETFDAEVIFQKALKERQSGNYDKSIEYFQSILAQRPALGRARLELATAYVESQRYEEAMKQLRLILDNPSTPEAVRKNVREYLSLVRRSIPTHHRFATSVSMGLMYDSNANAGPSSATFPIPSGSITLVNSALKRKDWAGILRVGGTHTYIRPEKVTVADQDASLVWQSAASLYAAHYRKTNRNNLDVFTLRTGPALLTQNWKTSANLQYDHIRYGANSYANFISLNPALTLTKQQGRLEFNLDAIAQRRSYTQESNDDRDSAYLALGGSAGKVLSGDKVSIQGGLDLFRENASADYQSNKGAEAFIGFNYLVDNKTNIHGRVSRRWVNYQDTDPTFLVERDDKFDQLVVGAKRKLSTGKLGGWEVNGTVTLSRRASNIDAYDFKRSQIALTIGRNFD